MLKLWLIRHGKTSGNLQRRYVGRTDESLCPEGILDLQTRLAQGCYPPVKAVFASPMKRCRETAEYLYPKMSCTVVEGLQEMNFGAFEYQTYEQLKNREDYQHFLNSCGKTAPPDGESRQEVGKRVLDAFEGLLLDLFRVKCASAALVVHGGIIMKIMEHCVGKTYYDWQVANGEGYQLDCHFQDGVWQITLSKELGLQNGKNA